MSRTILATDLDGTFLGGNEAERARLYEWIAAHRNEIVLIFVSGRDFPFMEKLCEDLPVRADHVIGNVGTTVGCGPGWQPHAQIERWLDAAWPTDAADRIEMVCDRYPGLVRQPVVEGRRVSRYYTDPAEAQAAGDAVTQLGFDFLCSDNRFFDVLPRGIRKGPTLLRTLAALDLSPARTLVAGDTLNDLSLFETGLAGVAVGNSEQALLAAIGEQRNVMRSQEVGAAGVLEALQAFHEGGTPWEHRLS